MAWVGGGDRREGAQGNCLGAIGMFQIGMVAPWVNAAVKTVHVKWGHFIMYILHLNKKDYTAASVEHNVRARPCSKRPMGN